MATFFSCLIFFCILYFAIRYRRKSEKEVPPEIEGSLALELTWTIIPGLLTMVMFVWGASVFIKMQRPPDNAISIYVVGKQWMWKLQHMEGQREINELHIPVNRPVKLIMTSEDVIHSFFVPAFRTKQDVLPGRYTMEWFQPNKPGRYHLFCAEYCGTKHSGMIGWIDVMEPSEYQAWLSGGRAMGSLAEAGEKLFQRPGLHQLPSSDRPGTLSEPGGSVRPAGETLHRRDGEGGRGLHPRVDSESECQGRRRLPADHADVPGAGDGGRCFAIDRIHQVAGTKARRSARRGHSGP